MSWVKGLSGMDAANWQLSMDANLPWAPLLAKRAEGIAHPKSGSQVLMPSQEEPDRGKAKEEFMHLRAPTASEVVAWDYFTAVHQITCQTILSDPTPSRFVTISMEVEYE